MAASKSASIDASSLKQFDLAVSSLLTLLGVMGPAILKGIVDNNSDIIFVTGCTVIAMVVAKAWTSVLVTHAQEPRRQLLAGIGAKVNEIPATITPAVVVLVLVGACSLLDASFAQTETVVIVGLTIVLGLASASAAWHSRTYWKRSVILGVIGFAIGLGLVLIKLIAGTHPSSFG